MKKVALQGMIFGSLFLSLELYLLKLVQFSDKVTGSWYENIWVYGRQFPCNAALLITVAVILFSAVIFFTGKNSSKPEEDME